MTHKSIDRASPEQFRSEGIRSLVLVLSAITVLAVSPLRAQWVQTNGPYGGGVSCFATSPNESGGTNIFAGTGNGIFLSTNNGANWTAVDSGLTDLHVRALAISGTNLFAGTDRGGVYRSTNDGTTWAAVNSGLPKDMYDTTMYVSVSAFAIAPNGTEIPSLFAGTSGHGIFLSTDNGTSWTAVNDGLPRTGDLMNMYNTVTSFAVSPNEDGGADLFVGTLYTGGIFLSTNNGTSWIPAGLRDSAITALAVSSNKEGGTNLYAGLWDYGIFLSVNNGTSWKAANSGLYGSYVNVLLSVEGTLFAGSGAATLGRSNPGIFLSADDGISWSTANFGLPPGTRVYDLVTCPDGAGGMSLFAGTSTGLWKRPLSEMITTGVKISKTIPAEFALFQNYPNPFNPATAISYQLPAVSHVTLKVFDLLGREVATLVNEVKQAGSYTVTWDAARLASGIYLCRLQAENFTETKKLILLR